MKVVERPDGGGWCVVDDRGEVLAGPFETNEQAWRWVDRNNDADVGPPSFWTRRSAERRRL